HFNSALTFDVETPTSSIRAAEPVMTVTYQLTSEDLLRAIRDSYLVGMPRRLLRAFIIMTTAGLVIAMVMATVKGKLASFPTLLAHIWPDLILLAASVILACTVLRHWWLIPSGARRLFTQMKSLQLPKEFSIEERGLRFRDCNDNSL